MICQGGAHMQREEIEDDQVQLREAYDGRQIPHCEMLPALCQHEMVPGDDSLHGQEQACLYLTV